MPTVRIGGLQDYGVEGEGVVDAKILQESGVDVGVV